MSGSQEDKEHRLFYKRSIRRYGVDNIRALHWNSRDTQKVRFEQLFSIGNLSEKRILDLGCGTGDFRTFLASKGVVPQEYAGVDFLDEFILEARRKHPNDLWICENFLDFFPKGKFDFVICNGALNVKKADNMEFLKRFFEYFIPMTKEALGITLLKYAHGYYADPMIHTYEVEQVRALLRSLGKPFQIIEDYADNDFTCLIQTSLFQ